MDELSYWLSFEPPHRGFEGSPVPQSFAQQRKSSTAASLAGQSPAHLRKGSLLYPTLLEFERPQISLHPPALLKEPTLVAGAVAAIVAVTAISAAAPLQTTDEPTTLAADRVATERASRGAPLVEVSNNEVSVSTPVPVTAVPTTVAPTTAPPTTAPPTTAPPTTAPPTTQAPKPTSTNATGNDVWAKLAQCESGGKANINSGNGYYGAFQFSAQTWRSVGGSGLPHQHSYEEQKVLAQKLQAQSGWGQWPVCSKKLGLR